MRLVVLPGLDGTATLHAAFVDAVRDGFESVEVIAYPADRCLDYVQLEALVRTRLPARAPFVLLAESFSGPLALTIGSAPPANLAGIALSTTFARAPVPLASLLAPLARLAPVRALPSALLDWHLLGRWRTPALSNALRHALATVSPAVLRHRSACAMRVDVSRKLERIEVPVLCIHATRDRLLMAGTSGHLASTLRRCTLRGIDGPHLLLQAAPRECAAAVREFAATLD